MTRHGVELLLRGQRVAAHARNDRRGGFTTVEAHMPAAHRAHLEWTPQRLIDWGQRVGLACGELVTRLLQTFKHPEHGYRSCLGLLSLSRRYGNARLEAACERALALGTLRYRHVRDLLANNRDLLTDDIATEWEIIDDRSAQRATVIIHQLPIEHWHAWLGDPTVADAILDRLMQHCRRFNLEGESRRTGQAARPAGKPQKLNKEAQS